MKGVREKPIDPELDRHRAHTQLLPMVMESMNYGALIPSHRKYMKVLVVNSHPDVLTFFDDYLTLKGCEVLSMDDGALASEALLVEDFDIAFIELSMPNYDGISLMRTFKEMVAADAVAVVDPGNAVTKFNDGSGDSSPAVEMLQSAIPSIPSSMEAYKPVLTYNPNMLMVGMEGIPFSRSAEAVGEGMKLMCPVPMDVRFIGRIIHTWRLAATVNEALDEINEQPPSLHNDEYENSSLSRQGGKDKDADLTPSEKERKDKRRERKEEKKKEKEKEKTARESQTVGPCGWFLAMIGFGPTKKRRGADKVYIK